MEDTLLVKAPNKGVNEFNGLVEAHPLYFYQPSLNKRYCNIC